MLDETEIELEVALATSQGEVGRRAVHGGIVRLGGLAISTLLTVGAAAIALRALGVSEYGKYASVMAILLIVHVVADVGVSAVGAQELALEGSPQAREMLLRRLVTLRTIAWVIGLVLAGGLALVLYGPALAAGTVVAGTGLLLYGVQASALLPLGVQLRNVPLAANEIIRNLTLVVLIAAAALLSAPLGWYFAVQLASGLVSLLMLPLITRDSACYRGLIPTTDIRGAVRLARKCAPVSIGALMTSGYGAALLIAASVLVSETDTSLLGASTRVIDGLGALPAVLGGVVLPVLAVAATQDPEKLAYVARRFSEGMLLSGTALGLTVAVGAPAIMRLIGGTEFGGAAPLLEIQCVAVVVFFLTSCWTIVCIAMGRFGQVVWSTVAGAAVICAVGPLAIKLGGVEGAAWTLAAGQAAVAAYLWFSLRRVGLAREISAGFAAKLALVVAAILAAVAVVNLPSALEAVVAALLFALACAALRLVPPEFADAVRRVARAT